MAPSGRAALRRAEVFRVGAVAAALASAVGSGREEVGPAGRCYEVAADMAAVGWRGGRC